MTANAMAAITAPEMVTHMNPATRLVFTVVDVLSLSGPGGSLTGVGAAGGKTAVFFYIHSGIIIYHRVLACGL